jgi:arylsulfatase A-like enzyme
MQKQPNILFIMSDDHASNAVSIYGSRLAKDAPTPNLDRIGKEGMVMTNCHCTNSICTPSRATILTGQHSHMIGCRTLVNFLPDDAVTVPKLLQKSGYQTAIFGKWHLRGIPHGFDKWSVLLGQGYYHDPVFCSLDESLVGDGEILEDHRDIGELTVEDRVAYRFGLHVRHTGYVTDIVTDKTLEWLEQRDPEKPFYLCCQHKAPHDFFEYDHKHEHAFDRVEFEEPETLFEDEQTQQEISRRYGTTVSERWEPRNMVKHLMDENYPNGGPIDFSGLDFRERAQKAYQKYMQDYLRTVRSVDENVGRILDYLDERGLTENTIVIYTSDQGMMLGEHDHIDKRWIFDESQRMPFLIRYPEAITPGQVSDDIVDNCDFAPTLLDYADVEIPEPMQGRSFRSILESNAPADWRQSTYYRYWMHMTHHDIPAHYGIRTKEYKLVFFYGMMLDAECCNTYADTEPGFELYDLKKDPFETTNVYRDPAYAGAARELKQQLLELKIRYQDTDDKYPELMALQRELF